MKISIKNSNSLFVNIAVICIASFLFSSCAKDDISIDTAPVTQAAVTVFQASPDQPNLDIYLNKLKLNLTPVVYGSNTGYTAINSGLDTTVFKNSATGGTILSSNIPFTQNTANSLFLVGTTASPGVLLLTDTLAVPATGNASIRFVNVSPDAPAVDLVITGGATLVTNKAFKGFSSFQPITGNVIYNIEVHQAGTSTVLATLTNYKLNAGFLYTFWLRGLVNSSSAADKLTIDIMNNAYYVQ
jgi:hypothetical protein